VCQADIGRGAYPVGATAADAMQVGLT
jgi:hypothetical protein